MYPPVLECDASSVISVPNPDTIINLEPSQPGIQYFPSSIVFDAWAHYTYVINMTRVDEYSNRAQCQYTITLVPEHCASWSTNNVENGQLVCVGVHCFLYCNEGFVSFGNESITCFPDTELLQSSWSDEPNCVGECTGYVLRRTMIQ